MDRIHAVCRPRPFVGYLLPSENVTQIIALTLSSFAADPFIPLSHFSPDLQTFAKFTPLYGLNQLVRDTGLLPVSVAQIQPDQPQRQPSSPDNSSIQPRRPA